MVADRKLTDNLGTEITQLYGWLDDQIRKSANLAGKCNACGKCCDFEKYGHRLFVTTPELLYLAQNLHPDKLKPMTTGRCPYNSNGKCGIYEYRFTACRVFCCKGDTDFQSSLSESAIRRLKGIGERFDIAYRYTDLASALNSTS